MSNNSINILVPNLPESVVDATVAVWHKKVGDQVMRGDILLEIETDKIMLEIPSENTGILKTILEKEGSIVTSGQILGCLNCNDYIPSSSVVYHTPKKKIEIISDLQNNTNNISPKNDENCDILTPFIRKLKAEYNLSLENIKGTGSKGRLTRQDVEKYIHNKKIEYSDNQNNYKNIINDNDDCQKVMSPSSHRKDRRVLMNRLRKKISERLLNVTNTTAMLTTFNEVNVQPIMAIRKKYGELFEKKHGVKLGLMAFYVKAVIFGLKYFPEINASIDGDEIVYHNYYDISIAVSTKRGLVTPVLRDADSMSIFEIEKYIKYLAKKGKHGKLTIEELQGGNFTITNGGIFGSLISTPILNPPQSAILGMHAIKERPVALKGNIVILPMMYLALSYDHRLIDGKDSVSFLVYIKELLEDPIRFILDM